MSFYAEPVEQDGFAFRAVKVWTGATEPPPAPPPDGPGDAYRGELTLTFDEPT